jgi:hypothetical protein
MVVAGHPTTPKEMKRVFTYSLHFHIRCGQGCFFAKLRVMVANHELLKKKVSILPSFCWQKLLGIQIIDTNKTLCKPKV